MPLDLSPINVLAEFERCGITQFDYASSDELKICCPFHDDKTPSCHVNIKKKLFQCHTAGCLEHGNFIKLMSRILQTPQAVYIADLTTRYDIEDDKLIDVSLVETCHAAIWKAQPLLQALYDRALTDDMIRQYRLGEKDGRITIPIPNRSGYYVNLRKYLPGAPGKDKMRNTSGHGSVRLFPISQLQYDTIVFCGGECKAIVAAAELNQYGIGAICATCGEDNFTPEILRELKDKRVYVLLDIDKPGQAAARKLCLHLNAVASWVANVVLPLDADKYPKGDTNDFKKLGGELKPLLDAAIQYIPDVVTRNEVPLEVAEETELSTAIHADNTGRRMAIKCVVSAMDTSPYVVPRDLVVTCPQDQKECAACPVFLQQQKEWTIQPEALAILEFVNAPNERQFDVVKRTLGIPRSCRVCDFDTKTHYNVEDVRISPALEITNRNSDKVQQPAYCIGRGLTLNESYQLRGRLYPNPKTQQSTLLISEYNPTQDALSTYQLREPEQLGVFWPSEWTLDGITNKLTTIYDDLAANVTRIFHRESIHLAVDLTYYSPLFLPFDGKVIKGWVESLIMGDSSLGKSEVTCGSNGPGGLMAHYGLGEKIEMKNATVAGVLGGLQQMGTRWFVSWGVVPTHDKRLVIMEEVKGASTEVISRLTDMRSSGIAEIPKIEKRKTHARTRLIWISNPRSDMRLAQYNFGIEAIRELIGGLEDVRRFDFALLVGDSEIDGESINRLQRNRPQIEHVYTAELCRSLVLWAWTRKQHQIEFSADATELILSEATRLSNKYTSAIPLVDRGSMRYKLARLSASLAARLFSCTEDFSGLLIYPCHVEYIVRYLETNYDSSVFGYLDYTKAIQVTQELLDPAELTAAIAAAPFPKDLVKQLLAKNKIDLQDLCDWCSWERGESQILLSLFVRKHALMRDGKAYRKTSPFITLLKSLQEDGTLPHRPEFTKGMF